MHPPPALHLVLVVFSGGKQIERVALEAGVEFCPAAHKSGSHTFTWAPDTDEALKLLSDVVSFDVVFSDVAMPGMGGVELGQEIRRRHPGLPVVLTSGYSNVLAAEGRQGFELLQKPYAAEELSRVLRHVTRVLRSGS